MENQLKIRKASLEDVNLIAEIKTKAYRDEKERFKPEEDKIPKWFYSEWYIDIPENIRLINEYNVYLLTVNEVVIGTFWVHDVYEDTIELEDFCILPEYQGFGYGYKALNMMEGMFEKKKRWVLGTPFYSIKNHYLYQKAGYKKVGTVSDETVIVYEKIMI
ncbi:GNAT family N-acetyltransferase [Clostridium cellulovorans]|uniref:GCN5-related N-acetyltransferase n=1 Tax=Clostridium cellulovorans (strain ATCC 35296 / DSM 3052 / OCM 3 / 743B) TaxID=573061 RepID=D9STA0_CLOC7|nr:GNAT family N-acetyltransferase [Clostridium cellulovorans]ADL50716.1 GCN5-related N-acetyltransferase [Clostridium cellulovorans 743B]